MFRKYKSKSQGIPNYDEEYHESRDISLSQFNQNYITYLNEKQERISQLKKLQNVCYIWVTAANTGYFCYANFDVNECIAGIDTNLSLTDMRTLAGITFNNPNFESTVQCVVIDAACVDLPTAYGQMLEYIQILAYQFACVDMSYTYSLIGFTGNLGGKLQPWFDSIIERVFGTSKVFKPIVVGEDQLKIIMSGKTPLSANIWDNFSKTQKEIYINAIESEFCAFAGDFPKTPQFHLVFFGGHSFYVPDYYVPLDVSQEFEDWLVCISQFWPMVQDIIIMPRFDFAAYHRSIDYNYFAKKPNIQYIKDRVVAEMQGEDFWGLVNPFTKMYSFYPYGQMRRLYKFSPSAWVVRAKDVSDLQSMVLLMARNEGDMELNQVLAKLMFQLTTAGLNMGANLLLSQMVDTPAFDEAVGAAIEEGALPVPSTLPPTLGGLTPEQHQQIINQGGYGPGD